MTADQFSRVLVTGATGFIGAHVVESLLARGVSVRAATGSKQKGELMRKARPQYAPKLEIVFLEVQDFNQLGVFDNAFTYNTTDNGKELIVHAINGIKSILSASAQPGTKVKRVVMTPSFASVLDLNRPVDPNFVYAGAHWNPLTYEEAFDSSSTAVTAYRGSKKFAELEAWSFMERENPGFHLVTFGPPMVFGPVVHPVANVAQLKESNAVLWSVLPLVSRWVDVRDFAEAHVQALFTSTAGGKRYVAASSEPFSYELAADIMRAEFVWAKGSVTMNYEAGKKVRESYKLDGESATRELGVQFRSLRETVVDFVRQVKEEIPK